MEGAIAGYVLQGTLNLFCSAGHVGLCFIGPSKALAEPSQSRPNWRQKAVSAAAVSRPDVQWTWDEGRRRMVGLKGRVVGAIRSGCPGHGHLSGSPLHTRSWQSPDSQDLHSSVIPGPDSPEDAQYPPTNAAAEALMRICQGFCLNLQSLPAWHLKLRQSVLEKSGTRVCAETPSTNPRPG